MLAVNVRQLFARWDLADAEKALPKFVFGDDPVFIQVEQHRMREHVKGKRLWLDRVSCAVFAR